MKDLSEVNQLFTFRSIYDALESDRPLAGSASNNTACCDTVPCGERL
jgi:hypothetical protein